MTFIPKERSQWWEIASNATNPGPHSHRICLSPAKGIALLSYFLILEDLILRFNLRDYHVLLCGFIYGMIQETFNTGSVFDEAFVLGVNPVYIFMANVLWWGILQSVFAYYFATTIVKRNDSPNEKMGKRGWTLAIGINAFFFSVLALERNLPDGTTTGYLVSVILILSAIMLLIALRKPKNVMKIKRVRFVDRLIRIQFRICIVMAIMNTIVLGNIAVILFVFWSVFTGIVYLILALKGHRFVGKFEPLELSTQFSSQ